jgi:hypothetical protein
MEDLSELGKYLKEMDYSNELVQAAEKMQPMDNANLMDLVSHFDFGEHELKIMINYPECINRARWMCNFAGGLDTTFIKTYSMKAGV